MDFFELFPALLLLLFSLQIFAFMHCLRRKEKTHSKYAWLFTIAMLPFLGTIAYFLFGTHKKTCVESNPSENSIPPATEEGE